MVAVLFVCLGNICRSPSGEGIFRDLVDKAGLGQAVSADSAGTGAYHIGEPPDRRAQATARRRGIDLSGQRARQVRPEDFHRFDYLIAMDRDNRANLLALSPPGLEHKVHLMLDFSEANKGGNVPDPYYIGGDGFETAFDLIEDAARGLLEDIRRRRL